MRKPKSKLLALLLCTVMIFSITGNAFAASTLTHNVTANSSFYGMGNFREPVIKNDRLEGFDAGCLVYVGSAVFDSDWEYTDVEVEYAITSDYMRNAEYDSPDGSQPFNDFYLVIGDDPWASDRCFAGPYNAGEATSGWSSYKTVRSGFAQYWCGPDKTSYWATPTPYYRGDKVDIDLDAYKIGDGEEQDIYLLANLNGPMNVKNVKISAVAPDLQLLAAAQEAEKAAKEAEAASAENAAELRAAADKAAADAEASKAERVVFEAKDHISNWEFLSGTNYPRIQSTNGVYHTAYFNPYTAYLYLGEYDFGKGAPDSIKLTYGLDPESAGDVANNDPYNNIYVVTGDNPTDTASRGWAEVNNIPPTDSWTDFKSAILKFGNNGWPTAGKEKVWLMVGGGMSGLNVSQVKFLDANGDDPAGSGGGSGSGTGTGNEVVTPNPDDNNTTTTGTGFTDVAKDAYFAPATQWAVEKGITTGTTKTTFGPNELCTRAQTVTFLWRAAGSPEPKSTNNPFTDLKSGDYYYNAVLWAVENGITSGTTATTFAPNEVCTRGQVVTFMWRAEQSPEVTAADNQFTDTAKDAFYFDAVKWAVNKEITTGATQTTFEPNGNCSRAQIVTFLYRGYNK